MSDLGSIGVAQSGGVGSPKESIGFARSHLIILSDVAKSEAQPHPYLTVKAESSFAPVAPVAPLRYTKLEPIPSSISSSAMTFPTTLRAHLSSINVGGNEYVAGSIDTTEGYPSQPSLRMDGYGKWRFRWKVNSGSRTISVRVKQAVNETPRPSIVIKANSSIGITEDVSGSAAAGVGWVLIGPIAVAPTSMGAVWVELKNNLVSQYTQTPCYWDNIETT